MRRFPAVMMAATIVACTWGVPASAVVLHWGLDADNDWNNPNNWSPDGVIVGPVPGAADHAIIFESTISPLITGAAAPTVHILTPSWYDGQTTSMDIGPGGSISTADFDGGTGFTRLSGGDNTSSTVNFLPGAGVSVWPILQMSFDTAHGGLPPAGHESDSFINLDGGILHVGSLGFSNNGLNTTNIDIGGIAQLLVNGDQTDGGNGNATAWINAGYLTAEDGSGVVDVVYDGANGRTVFTVGAASEISGDYNDSGQVEQGDLDLVLLNWGSLWPPEIPEWVNQQPTDDGVIDQNDLDGVLLNWGNASVPASVPVPEPSSLLLLLISGWLMGRLRRNS